MAQKTLAEKIKGLIHYNIIPQLQDILTSIVNGFKTIKFTDLTDVPTTYTGQGGKVVTVKSDATGLEFTTPSGGGSQSLGQVLAIADREVKTILVSDLLADTGNYTFEDGDETKLIILNANNANDDTVTFTLPEVTPDFAEYKVLFTTGQNGFTNNVVTYTPVGGNEIFGRAIQNSNENSIACIKVLLGGGNSSITYQSSAGDSALIYAAALNHETVTQISGVLIVGHQYYIQTYNAVDDFTNVGANDNVEGDFFTATGTTPTLWLSGSVLQDVTASTAASVATNSIGAISVIEVVGSDNQFNAISDGLFNEKTFPSIAQASGDFMGDSYARVVDANTIVFSMGEDLGGTVSAYLTIIKYN